MVVIIAGASLVDSLAHHVTCISNILTYCLLGSIDQGGKLSYMASAASEICNNHHIDITRNSTLLIDDDVKNVRNALDNGVRALYFRPEQPNRLDSTYVDKK